MVAARDVAAFIESLGTAASKMKLQKLLYYSQAWSLVWDGAPLFAEPIQAWDDGPVVRSLWAERTHGLTAPPADAGALSDAQRQTVSEVIRFYGTFDGDQLSALTHRERPWLRARGGAPRGARHDDPVSNDEMRAYYCTIPTTGKHLPEEYARGVRALMNMTPEEAEELCSDAAPQDGDELLALLERGA